MPAGAGDDARRAFAVRLPATQHSLRETEAILRCFGVVRSFQSILRRCRGSLTAFSTHHRRSRRGSRSTELLSGSTPNCLEYLLQYYRHESASGRRTVQPRRNGSGSRVPPATRRETRTLQHGTSRRSVRLSDCSLPISVERSGGRRRSKPYRTLVSHARYAGRPFSQLAGAVGRVFALVLFDLSTGITFDDSISRSVAERLEEN